MPETLAMFSVEDPYVYVQPRRTDVPHVWSSYRRFSNGSRIVPKTGEAYVEQPDRGSFGDDYQIWIASGPNGAYGLAKAHTLNGALKIARLWNADKGILPERPSEVGLLMVQRDALYEQIEKTRRKSEMDVAAIDDQIRILTQSIGHVE